MKRKLFSYVGPIKGLKAALLNELMDAMGGQKA